MIALIQIKIKKKYYLILKYIRSCLNEQFIYQGTSFLLKYYIMSCLSIANDKGIIMLWYKGERYVDDLIYNYQAYYENLEEMAR